MQRRIFLPIALFLSTGLGALACTVQAEDDELFASDRCEQEGVTCQAYGRRNHENRPEAYELGSGTRAPRLTVVYEGQPGTQPVDLEFNPRRPRELWVVHYASSHVTVVTNPGNSRANVVERRDPA